METAAKLLLKYLNGLNGVAKKDDTSTEVPHGFSAALKRKRDEFNVVLSELLPGIPTFSDKPTGAEIATAREVIAKAVEDNLLTRRAKRALSQFALLAGLNVQALLPIKMQPPGPHIPSIEDALVWLDNNQVDIINSVRVRTKYIRSFNLTDADILRDARDVTAEAFQRYMNEPKDPLFVIRYDRLFMHLWVKHVWTVYLKNLEIPFKRDQLKDVSAYFIEPALKLFWDTHISNKPVLREHRISIGRILKELDLHTACSSIAPFSERKPGMPSEVFNALATVPLWEHSLGVAEIAIQQAKQFKVALGDAVVAALAHDAGKLPVEVNSIDEGEDPLAISHAKMSGERFAKICGGSFKNFTKVWKGIDDYHSGNLVTPIGKLLVFCNAASRQKELEEVQSRGFLANINPNPRIRLRVAEIEAGSDDLSQFTKTLPRPASTEAVEQIKLAVKELRSTWQPGAGKKPSLAQTYQLVAKAMGYKTWEGLVASAEKAGE